MTTLYAWPPTRPRRAKQALEALEIDGARRRPRGACASTKAGAE